jgi:hypothetical protein
MMHAGRRATSKRAKRPGMKQAYCLFGRAFTLILFSCAHGGSRVLPNTRVWRGCREAV